MRRDFMNEYEELLKEFGMERKKKWKEEECRWEEELRKEEESQSEGERCREEDSRREEEQRQKKKREQQMQQGMSGVFDGTTGGNFVRQLGNKGKNPIRQVEVNRRNRNMPRIDWQGLPWRNIVIILAVIFIVVLVAVNISAIIAFLTDLFINLLYIVLVVGLSFYLIRRIIQGR